MKTLRDYIAEIHIVESNLQHIAKTGKINGSLLLSLEDKFKEYAIEVAKQALTNAANNVDPENCFRYSSERNTYDIIEQSILSESNIPSL